MLSYTFIIPILSILVSLVETRSMSSSDIRELSIRLASFGVLTISSKIISIFLKKLFKRFENVDKKTN
jgi:Na+-translocating ferredoxin:NAD+ oxidoreductase RnfE subunit